MLKRCREFILFCGLVLLLTLIPAGNVKAGETPDGTYNYLAIGNSITKHPITSLWWGEWGMAATTPENDYYHLVSSYLAANAPGASSQAFYFKSWEDASSGAGRTAALSSLDSCLNSGLDLVTIQLGENVFDQADLANDYANLIAYIKARAPSAQIIMIGEFWPDASKDQAKIQACLQYDIAYINLGPIQGPGYRVGLGTSVYGADGAWHTVTNDAVAEHPNNAAMRYIADQVMGYMDFTWWNGTNYAAVFDENYYYNTYPDIQAVIGNVRHNLFLHFVNYGMGEGRQASAAFDVQYYKEEYPDLRGAYGADLASYYRHYCLFGRSEGRQATGTPVLTGTVTTINGVDYSAVYNYDYYLAANPDVAAAFSGDDVAVLNHFVNYGMNEGRAASENFNVHAYKAAYADLRMVYGTDIRSYYLHYMNYGQQEGRTATTGSVTVTSGITANNGFDYSAVYDYNYYIAANPDVAAAFPDDDVAVLNHFVTCGMSEGRMAKSDFDVHAYQAHYADLQAAYGDNLREYYEHYCLFGKNERRSPM